MKLTDLLDETTQLSDELSQLDSRMQIAARRGDTDTLNSLAQRKRELPALIAESQRRDLAERINDQRTRLGVYEMDLKNAREVSHTLNSELPEKLKALEAEKQRLLNEAGQAQDLKESLEFAVSLETAEFERLKSERESLLLSQFVNQ